MGNQTSQMTLPAPNPNPPQLINPPALGTWIACIIAVLCVIALFVFVFLNRGRAQGVTGCRLTDVTLPDHISTADDHKSADARTDVIVVHHSNNCTYCKRFKSVVTSAADEMGLRVVFSEVSTSDANSDAFQKLGVSGVPAYTIQSKLVGVGYKEKDALLPVLAAAAS